MTPTEKGRRRDALLYGFDTRLQLCDMIANREADLEDALAENAALREECDGWKKVCVDQEIMHVMHEETLDNENEKLRELVRDMWKPFCWAQSGYEVCLTHEQDVAIRRRVCELGVDV